VQNQTPVAGSFDPFGMINVSQIGGDRLSLVQSSIEVPLLNGDAAMGFPFLETALSRN